MTEPGLDLSIDRPQESVAAQVVRAVRQAIAQGALAPGRRLTEPELMALTGVSRASIREAVQRLEALGLVEATPPRGMRVAVLDRGAVQHIFEVRDALESAAAELFVRNATDGEVDELVACVESGGEGSEERMAAIARFDEVLLRGARNPVLQGILSPLHTRIHALRRLSLTIPGRQAASDAEYVELAAAIRARAPERAAIAARAHVRAAAQAAFAALDQLDGRAHG